MMYVTVIWAHFGSRLFQFFEAMKPEHRRAHLTLHALTRVLKDPYFCRCVREEQRAALYALDRHFGNVFQAIAAITDVEDKRQRAENRSPSVQPPRRARGRRRAERSRSPSVQPPRRAKRRGRAERSRSFSEQYHARQKKSLPRPIPLDIEWSNASRPTERDRQAATIKGWYKWPTVSWPTERDRQAATIKGYDKQIQWSHASRPTERDRQAATIKGYDKLLRRYQPASRGEQLASTQPSRPATRERSFSMQPSQRSTRQRAASARPSQLARKRASESAARRGISCFPKGAEEIQENSDDDKDCVAGGLQLAIRDDSPLVDTALQEFERLEELMFDLDRSADGAYRSLSDHESYDGDQAAMQDAPTAFTCHSSRMGPTCPF